jgi:hypothetical protein
MSVSLNISVATQQVSGEQQGHGHGRRKAAMDAAAKALNMSSDDLQSALKSGKSLKDIAAAQGVDFSKVQSAMQEARQSQGAGQPQQQVSAGGHHHHHHHGGTQVQSAGSDVVGSNLQSGYSAAGTATTSSDTGAVVDAAA